MGEADDADAFLEEGRGEVDQGLHGDVVPETDHGLLAEVAGDGEVLPGVDAEDVVLVLGDEGLRVVLRVELDGHLRDVVDQLALGVEREVVPRVVAAEAVDVLEADEVVRGLARELVQLLRLAGLQRDGFPGLGAARLVFVRVRCVDFGRQRVFDAFLAVLKGLVSLVRDAVLEVFLGELVVVGSEVDFFRGEEAELHQGESDVVVGPDDHGEDVDGEDVIFDEEAADDGVHFPSDHFCGDFDLGVGAEDGLDHGLELLSVAGLRAVRVVDGEDRFESLLRVGLREERGCAGELVEVYLAVAVHVEELEDLLRGKYLPRERLVEVQHLAQTLQTHLSRTIALVHEEAFERVELVARQAFFGDVSEVLTVHDLFPELLSH